MLKSENTNNQIVSSTDKTKIAHSKIKCFETKILCKFIFIVVLVVCLLPLASCANFLPQPTSLERLELCQALSVDKVGDNLEVCIMLKKVKPSSAGSGDDSGGESGEEIIKKSGFSYSSIFRDFGINRAKMIFFGDIEAIVVSSSVLQDDFAGFVDFFLRSKDFSEYTNVYSVDSSAGDMLKDMQKYAHDPVDTVIKSKLKKAQMWTKPLNLLQCIQLLQPHTSGVIPLLTKVQDKDNDGLKDPSSQSTDQSGKGVKANKSNNKDTKEDNDNEDKDNEETSGQVEFALEGYAIIKDGKFGGVLESNKAFALNVLQNRMSDGVLSFLLPQSNVVVGLNNINTNTKLKSSKHDDNIVFDIIVSVNADLCEYDSNDKQLHETIVSKAQDTLSKRIETDIKDCLQDAKSTKADFVGFWNSYRFWNKKDGDKLKEEWQESILPNMSISVSVNSVIRQTY